MSIFTVPQPWQIFLYFGRFKPPLSGDQQNVRKFRATNECANAETEDLPGFWGGWSLYAGGK
jgi:hypothetical protein